MKLFLPLKFCDRLMDWNTDIFVDEALQFKDSLGNNSFDVLAECVTSMLVLVQLNADVERIFSAINIVKTKFRNQMAQKLDLNEEGTINATSHKNFQKNH